METLFHPVPFEKTRALLDKGITKQQKPYQ